MTYLNCQNPAYDKPDLKRGFDETYQWMKLAAYSHERFQLVLRMNFEFDFPGTKNTGVTLIGQSHPRNP
jgi:hypothetical protein